VFEIPDENCGSTAGEFSQKCETLRCNNSTLAIICPLLLINCIDVTILWAGLAKHSKEISCSQNLVAALDFYDARRTLYASSYENLVEKSAIHASALLAIFDPNIDICKWQTQCVNSKGVRNPMKISDIGFLKTEPKRPQNLKTENSVSAVRFSKHRLRRFGDGFSRCLIQNSSCSTTGSTVKVVFFMPYLCTSSSESLQLTISWTNPARKYVISSVMHIKQHTVKKMNQKPKPRLI